jgi:hypothetical protein
MKKIVFILSLLVLSGGFTPAQAAPTKCKDGTVSYSTGKGTCSYHGGIANGLSGDYDKINMQAAYALLEKQAKIDYAGSLIALYWLEGKHIVVEPGAPYPVEFNYGNNESNKTMYCFHGLFLGVYGSETRCFNVDRTQKELYTQSRLAAPCKNKTKLLRHNLKYVCVKNKFVREGK